MSRKLEVYQAWPWDCDSILEVPLEVYSIRMNWHGLCGDTDWQLLEALIRQLWNAWNGQLRSRGIDLWVLIHQYCWGTDQYLRLCMVWKGLRQGFFDTYHFNMFVLLPLELSQLVTGLWIQQSENLQLTVIGWGEFALVPEICQALESLR